MIASSCRSWCSQIVDAEVEGQVLSAQISFKSSIMDDTDAHGIEGVRNRSRKFDWSGNGASGMIL